MCVSVFVHGCVGVGVGVHESCVYCIVVSAGTV